MPSIGNIWILKSNHIHCVMPHVIIWMYGVQINLLGSAYVKIATLYLFSWLQLASLYAPNNNIITCGMIQCIWFDFSIRILPMDCICLYHHIGYE